MIARNHTAYNFTFATTRRKISFPTLGNELCYLSDQRPQSTPTDSAFRSNSEESILTKIKFGRTNNELKLRFPIHIAKLVLIHVSIIHCIISREVRTIRRSRCAGQWTRLSRVSRLVANTARSLRPHCLFLRFELLRCVLLLLTILVGTTARKMSLLTAAITSNIVIAIVRIGWGKRRIGS